LTVLFGGLIAILVLLVAFGYSPVRKLSVLQRESDSRWAELYQLCLHRAEIARDIVPVLSAAEDLDPQLVVHLKAAQAGLSECHFDPARAPRDAAGYAVFVQRQGAMYQALAGVLNTSLKNPKLRTDPQFKSLVAQLLLTARELTVHQGRFVQAGIAYNEALRHQPAAAYGAVLGFRPRTYLGQLANAPVQPL
jgi:hypothetical protein